MDLDYAITKIQTLISEIEKVAYIKDNLRNTVDNLSVR